MSDGPGWFAPKRYGIGSTPVTWQGWVLTIGFVAVLVVVVFSLRGHPAQVVAATIPVIAIFIVICAKTTRGGWRWRWGDEE